MPLFIVSNLNAHFPVEHFVTIIIFSLEFREKVFLACDNDPVSKQEICRSALASGLYPGCPHPQVANHLLLHQPFCVQILIERWISLCSLRRNNLPPAEARYATAREHAHCFSGNRRIPRFGCLCADWGANAYQTSQLHKSGLKEHNQLC